MKGNLVKKLKKRIEEGKDKKINKKNKKLLIDKILSYSPELVDGIERYKKASHIFMILMCLSAILVELPLLSMPCCAGAVVFLVRMLQFIKYKNIDSILNTLSKDLVYKGIYNKGKIQGLIEDFKDKFGRNNLEYEKLVYMVDRYEVLVTKIEYVLNGMKTKECSEVQEEIPEEVVQENLAVAAEPSLKDKVKDYYKDINDKLSLTCKNEEGEIRKINRAIEFFEDEGKDGEKSNTVVLKSNRKGKKDKLTVYLYKKSSELQNNIL